MRGSLGYAWTMVGLLCLAAARLTAVAAASGNLPSGAVTTVLPGGNHAGFGDYGLQKGDGTASITKEVQREAVVEAMRIFLAGLES